MIQKFVYWLRKRRIAKEQAMHAAGYAWACEQLAHGIDADYLLRLANDPWGYVPNLFDKGAQSAIYERTGKT